MIYQDIFGMVGNTPSVRVCMDNGPSQQFFIKLEGANPSGSIKDRACVFILRSALEEGKLVQGKTVLELAREQGEAEMISLLEKYHAKR